MNYADFHKLSISDPQLFWDREARMIDWHTPYTTVLDDSSAIFPRWFVGGKTNLCHNAVDRWLASQPDQPALIAVSTETIDGECEERTYSFAQLHAEVQRCAAMMLALGVQSGDRVLIYMPMIAEAVFAMLACARIGAVHSVVFGGFAAHSLATRIDDATPVLVVSADGGSRNGKVIPYKPLLDSALALARHQPSHVLMVNRGLARMSMCAGRDLDYNALRARHMDSHVDPVWLDSSAPAYILYTSGTTGKPKGVLRDVGGYAVAMASSMQHIFGGAPGETFFATSDIGWVVGHSYIVYGPLIAGMATILYEGTPTRPDAGIWWRLVQKYHVARLFSAPTAVRLLKKQPPGLAAQYDLTSLKGLYLAGEPLDQTTSGWIAGEIKAPVFDNYWQTESGWPILSVARGIDNTPTRLGSPGLPMPGYKVKIVDEISGSECGPNVKGVLVIEAPLPPGCMQSIYGDDERYLQTYWSNFGRPMYSTFDWGMRDSDGYYFILGRSDDVINVAGHRLGTREIEESITCHADVAEAAVVGIADQLKGQIAVAFVIVRLPELYRQPERQRALETALNLLVEQQLGAVARPARVHLVAQLPRTRSGKVMRRLIQAVYEGRDAGDLSTIDDPDTLKHIQAIAGGARTLAAA